MLTSRKQHLITKLQAINAIKFGEFILKSGATSDVYVDLRRVISFPEVFNDMVEAVHQVTQSLSYQSICGVPYGALPYASVLSSKQLCPLLMMRKEPKDYGTKKVIEGFFEPGQTCLVIEDVITTGGSLLQAIKQLEETGVVVRHVLCLVDRESGARHKLEEAGYQVHSLLRLSELTSSALKVQHDVF